MNVVYAVTTASVTMPGGYPVPVLLGTHWAADDPVVLQHPGLFSDDPRHGLAGTGPREQPAPVEQATAAPGERRQARRG